MIDDRIQMGYNVIRNKKGASSDESKAVPKDFGSVVYR